MADTPLTFDEVVKNLYNAKPEQRLQVAQKLKQANFLKGTPSSNFDNKFYLALATLNAEYTSMLNIYTKVGEKNVPNIYDFLADKAAEGSGSGSGTSKTSSQKYITSPSQTAKFLQPIAEDLLGRKLNKAELAKYTKVINAWQDKNPAVTTTGESSTRTMGGVDETQMIEEKLAATGEAKSNKASQAFTILMEELGGLQ